MSLSRTFLLLPALGVALPGCAAPNAPVAAVTPSMRTSKPALTKAQSPREFVLAALKELEKGPHSDAANLLSRENALYHHQVAEMAALQTLVYGWDKDPKRLDFALSTLRAFIADWRKRSQNGARPYTSDSDFFLGFPLLVACQNLQNAGKWPADAAFETDFKTLLRGVCAPNQRGAHNQSASRAVGTALALKLFPDLDRDGAWRKYVNDVRADWTKSGDTTENSANYSDIFLAAHLQIAQIIGTESDFKMPAARQMLARFGAQVSPSGQIPAYGDDGQGAPRRAISAWPIVFERAAALYNDGKYRTLAARVFEAQKSTPIHEIRAVQPIFWLALGENWANRSLKPAPVTPVSVLLERTETDGKVADKTLLSSDGGWLLGELTTGGQHAHREQAGALLHFERAGTQFLSGLGYHNRLPEHANTVLVARADQAFPFRDKLVIPGEWQEAVLPTAGLPGDPEKPGDPFAKRLEDLNFRVQHTTGKAVDFWLDEVRLSGPKGDKILLDFEKDAAGFSNSALDSDAKAGQNSLRISIGDGVSFNRPKPVPQFSFDAREFTQFRFWWKIAPETQMPANNRILIARTGPAEHDFVVALQPFAPALQNAGVQSNVSGDSFSSAKLSGIGANGANWMRKMWLLREGALIVRDEITPASNSQNEVAGPIWHLQVPQKPQSGSGQGFDWFSASNFYGGKSGLLVAIERAPGRETGVSTPPTPLWERVNPQTVWSKAPLEVGKTAVFTSVLLPHENGAGPEKLAANLKIAGDKVSFQSAGKTVELALKDGPPQVVRP